MPKSTMTAVEDQTNGWPDGGVPDIQVHPPADRKFCCEEHAHLERGDIITTGRIRWEVRGWAEDGRVWVKAVDSGNTKWWACTVVAPACTPEESVVCTCGISDEGFTLDPDGLWVHAKCMKPTAVWLSGHAARQGAASW